MEQLIIGVFEQGFIYAIMALGVYITYKILDFPDLSVDSTFPLGAAVTTVMLSSGKNPLLALIAATAAGAIAGMVTGIIHVKFKVRDLLSGIIVMTGLYTLNLRIVGGSANVPLFNYKSVFDNDFINGIFPEALAPYKTVIIIFIIINWIIRFIARMPVCRVFFRDNSFFLSTKFKMLMFDNSSVGVICISVVYYRISLVVFFVKNFIFKFQ